MYSPFNNVKSCINIILRFFSFCQSLSRPLTLAARLHTAPHVIKGKAAPAGAAFPLPLFLSLFSCAPVFPAGGQSPADVPLGLVLLQDLLHRQVQRPVAEGQALGEVLVDRGLAQAELPGRGAHGGAVLYQVKGQIAGPLLQAFFDSATLPYAPMLCAGGGKQYGIFAGGRTAGGAAGQFRVFHHKNVANAGGKGIRFCKNLQFIKNALEILAFDKISAIINFLIRVHNNYNKFC